MRHAVTLLGALALALSLSGCPTSFTGNAHVSDGKAGCERKCKQSGLRFSGMVFLGEYSSACMCEPKQASAPSEHSGASAPAPLPAAPVSDPAPSTLPPAAPAPVPPVVPGVSPTTAPTSGGARPAGAAAGAAVAVMLQQVREDEGYTPITLVD